MAALSGVKIYYNYPDSGMDNLNSNWKKRAEIKKEISLSLKNRNRLAEDHQELLSLIKNHDIVEAKQVLDGMMNALQSGMQEAYDSIFEELLLLKDKLESDIEFLKKHASEFTIEELSLYQIEFLVKTSILLEGLKERYIRDVKDAIRYEDFGKYHLEKVYDSGIIKSISEMLGIKNLVKKTFKLENKIVKLDASKISNAKLKNIISTNAEYHQDFEELMRKMLILNLSMISKAYEIADTIENGIKNFDLTPGHNVYSNTIKQLIQHDGTESLKSLNRAIVQLKVLIKNAGNILYKALEEKTRQENQNAA